LKVERLRKDIFKVSRRIRFGYGTPHGQPYVEFISYPV
jgi:hypothetical protein